MRKGVSHGPVQAARRLADGSPQIRGGFALIPIGATPAQAISCGTTFSNDKQYFEWVHTNAASAYDVDGVRASIKFRLDGALCDFSPLNKQGTAIWIAIIGTGGTDKIVQMGIVKDYNPFGITETCFVWAIEGGSANNYNCTGVSDDSSENFYIHTWNNGSQYILADCGPGGSNTDYSNCTVKSSSQAVWTQPLGLSSEEELNASENYGTDQLLAVADSMKAAVS